MTECIEDGCHNEQHYPDRLFPERCRDCLRRRAREETLVEAV